MLTTLKALSYEAGDLRGLDDGHYFDYEGYNPTFTLSMMEKYEPDAQTLLADIKLIAYLAIVRGTKHIKAMTKMSTEGKGIVHELSTKYHITDHVPKTKEEVTIARIIGIIPKYCATLLKNNKGRIIGTIPQDLPHWLCFPMAPSIIPTDMPLLYAKWLEWATSFNEIVNQGKDSGRVDFYGKIIWHASYMEMNERKAALRNLGMSAL
jgi:hypothetical protein